MGRNKGWTPKNYSYSSKFRKPKRKKKRKRRKQNRGSQGKGEFKRRPNESRKSYYGRYIRSKTWFRIRAMIIKRDSEECVVCGEEALHVHHWKYPKVFGTEKLKWLSAICYRCHGIIHEDYKYELDEIQYSKSIDMYSMMSLIVDNIQEELLSKSVSEEYLELFRQ